MKHDLVTMGNVTACGACAAMKRSDELWVEDCPGAITVESVQAKLDAGAREYTREETKNFIISIKNTVGRTEAVSLLFPYLSFPEVPDEGIQSIMLKAMKAYPELAATLLMDKPETTGLKMDEPPLPGAIDVTNVNGPAFIAGDDKPPDEHVNQSHAWSTECDQPDHDGHEYARLSDARYWFNRGWEAKGNAK